MVSGNPAADRAARALLALPDDEEIVLLVACGEPPEEFDVASSPRLPPERIAPRDDGKA